MNVLLTKKFMQSDIDYIKAGLSPGITLIEPKEFNEEGVLEKISEADAVLGGMFSESVLEAASHVKLFQIPWTGVDNIDFSLLSKHGIDTVCNSHSNAFVVAEYAVALYFSVAKKIPYHDRQLRQGDWNRISPDGNEVSPFSSSLTNQKVVLLGYGAVNKSIHQLLSGFKPKVKIVNRSGKLAEDAIDCELYSYDKLEEALSDANVVFVAIPLTAETKGLFNKVCFNAMNQKSVLINVARGSVIDEESLYSSLHSQSIYGAGIDTWYNYPKSPREQTFPSENFPFHELNNLVLSPHRAGYVDSGFPHLDDAIQNLNNLQAGAPLINRISVEHRY